MKKKERKSNSGHCSALAIMFVLPLRHTHIIFKNQVCVGGSKIGRVVQSRPRFRSRSLRPLTGAVTSPGSSRFLKDPGVEVANWGCCSNWFTPSQTGHQPTDTNFPVFQENFCQYLHSSETGFLFLTLATFHQLLRN